MIAISLHNLSRTPRRLVGHLTLVKRRWQSTIATFLHNLPRTPRRLVHLLTLLARIWQSTIATFLHNLHTTLHTSCRSPHTAQFTRNLPDTLSVSSHSLQKYGNRRLPHSCTISTRTPQTSCRSPHTPCKNMAIDDCHILAQFTQNPSHILSVTSHSLQEYGHRRLPHSCPIYPEPFTPLVGHLTLLARIWQSSIATFLHNLHTTLHTSCRSPHTPCKKMAIDNCHILTQFTQNPLDILSVSLHSLQEYGNRQLPHSCTIYS